MRELEPVVFGSDPPLLGVLTLPEARACGTRGVVVCAPLGHENVCAYRPLRTLADRVAESGLPALRFDWPDVGDSGDSETEGASARWGAAVGDAIAALRSRTGVTDVAIVGLRIGATLGVLAASAEPSVSTLVLLAPYATGRAYLRELRAFQALAEQTQLASDDPHPPLPEGAVEASGFLIPPAEVASLRSIDLTAAELSWLSVRRVLLATAQPDRGSEALAERLAGGGADVAQERLAELAHVWDGTNVSVLPRSCGDLVCNWLLAGDRPPVRPRIEATAASPAKLPVEGGEVREQAEVLDGPGGRLFAVSCEPASDPGDTWVVFLNAGKVRRSGPNRLTTAFARQWARAGVPSLRLDLRGIGDSDGDPFEDETPLEYDSAWYYKPGFLEDIREVLAWLSAERRAKRFALVGLCSGAALAFQAAIADERVIGAALLNPRVLYWDDRAAVLTAWQEARDMMRHPGSLRRLAQPGARSWGRDATRGAALALTGRGDEAWHRRELLGALDSLRARGVPIRTVFSGGDPGIQYLEHHLGHDYRSTLEAHGMAVEVIDGPDHTFRPLWSHDLLRAALERLLRSAGLLAADTPAQQVRAQAEP